MRVSFAQVATLAAALFHGGLAAVAPTATLSTGATLTGTIETNVAGKQVNAFLGIPFAEPPTGGKRWKQPTPKTISADLNATAYGSICHGNPALDAASGMFPQNEDCLYLNVFAPAGATAQSNLPVMVYVYGGGFVAGAANTHNGANLIGGSGQRVIVVTFNYRLGIFGFMSNDELLSEGEGSNFGLRDQEVAFEWVRQHIHSFGGNPDDITAFGESAGAVSLALHLLSREGEQKLFDRVILQSGAILVTQNMAPRAAQEKNVATVAAAVGCGGAAAQTGVLSCMRKADATTVFAATGQLNFSPTIDKVFMHEVPILRLLKGKVSRVPTVIGTNTDDGWFFSFGSTDNARFEANIRASFPLMTAREIAQVSALYPAANFTSTQNRTAEVFTDAAFVCPGEIISNLLSASVPATYRYRYNYPGMAFGIPLVLHAEDVDYVFNRVENLRTDDQTKAVVAHFQTLWTNFAIAGTPNGETANQAAEVWPAFNTVSKKQLIIQPTLAVEQDTAYMTGHAQRCAFWHAVETRIAAEFV